MKELVFVTGGAIRKVYIDGRKITLLSAELGFEPLIIDLDKIDEQDKKISKINMSEEEIQELKDLAKLGSEIDIIRDIKRDWQSQGWRCVKEA